jgi:hypothetical protein
MSEQQEQEYRLAAAECLETAQHTGDQRMRTQLVIIAQKWLERANAVFARRNDGSVADASDNQQAQKQ